MAGNMAKKKNNFDFCLTLGCMINEGSHTIRIEKAHELTGKQYNLTSGCLGGGQNFTK